MSEKESKIVIIWGNSIMDEKFTSIPNTLLRRVGELGITDREFHFICQLASFKFSDSSVIRPSYGTLAERMGKDRSSLRKTAQSLEKKRLLKRTLRKSKDGDYDTTIFDLSPLLHKLFPEIAKDGGMGEIAYTPLGEIAHTPIGEIAYRIKRKLNNTNGEENEIKVSPESFLKNKGLSEGQIRLILINRPDVTLDQVKETWNWVAKTPYFRNKQSTFYTALIENWSKKRSM